MERTAIRDAFTFLYSLFSLDLALNPNSTSKPMTDTTLLAIATIAGPVVAVAMSLISQARMEARQRKWNEEHARKLEEDRRAFEMTRANARGQYDDAWNVATRDRINEIRDCVRRIADAAETVAQSHSQFTKPIDPL